MYQVILKFKLGVKLIGWLITLLSLFLLMETKSSTNPVKIDFWITFTIINLITLSWLIAATRFSKYRNKEFVSVLVPYISGSIIFIVLFVSIWTIATLNI